MTETLLSPSGVWLFGRIVKDLKIVDPDIDEVRLLSVDAASTAHVPVNAPPPDIDGVAVKEKRRFLLKDQNADADNGIYYLEGGDLKKDKSLSDKVRSGAIRIVVKRNDRDAEVFAFDKKGKVVNVRLGKDKRHGPFDRVRTGMLSQVEQQLLSDRDPRLARIYGFSFEGCYSEIPRPMLFLVHGKGVRASEARLGGPGNPRRARAPVDPSLSGIGSADFQFSDDIMVWSYDKSDYTIRMDMETGMFEDILLAPMLSGDGPDMRGMNVRGMNVRGMNVRGMNVRGMNVRGGSSD